MASDLGVRTDSTYHRCPPLTTFSRRMVLTPVLTGRTATSEMIGSSAIASLAATGSGSSGSPAHGATPKRTWLPPGRVADAVEPGHEQADTAGQRKRRAALAAHLDLAPEGHGHRSFRQPALHAPGDVTRGERSRARCSGGTATLSWAPTGSTTAPVGRSGRPAGARRCRGQDLPSAAS